jgi:hypothetical protein
MVSERALEERLAREAAARREQAGTTPAPEQQPPTITVEVQKPVPPTPAQLRREETRDFAQDVANVKANVGTSSLTAMIEQYGETLYSGDIVTRTMQKTGYLPSRASDVMFVAGAVSGPEGIINPNVPSLFELGSKSPEFIAGRLVGEGMVLAGTSEVFSWVTKGTENPLRRPVEKWLMKSYEEQAKGAVESGKAASWSLKQKLVMKITGVTPNLARGEVSIPVVETVSKTGVISAVPKGLPFTDIGWELTEAPRMGGVMITKMPSVTTPKALEVFFGIGQELIPFGKIKGEGETLGFEKSIAKGEPMEKGLPSSMLEESYYPKVGGFDAALKEVNVKGATSWTKWPTTRSLMEEQKLLPFVTQTQLTRLGIAPYIPDMTVGSASSGLTRMLGIGIGLLPKAFSKQAIIPKLETMPKLESEIKLGLPSFEEPFETQKLKLFPQIYPAQKQRKRAIPMLDSMVSLKPLTETVSIPALTLDVPQMTKQERKQLLIPMLKMPTPYLQKQTPSFPTYPSRIPSMREPNLKGLGGGLFGKWFMRSHAIPTEKQIMRELGFGTRKRRGVKRRRR